MQHAFDVGKTKVKDCIKEYNRRGGTLERKKRSDAGKTLVNSNRKRDQMCSPFNWFAKQKRRQHQGEALESAELKEAYANLSEEDRLKCAQGMKTMLANMESEVKRVLKHTNGCISWEALAQQIAGGEKVAQPICGRSLAKWVAGTDGFRYMKTQTLPQCTTERTKKIRKRWAVTFHIFWEGAKMVAKEVQLLYTNIDEKWFYSLVIRLHNKVVPLFGVSPVFHRIHHKDNMDKLLAICAIGIAPIDNDLRKGGRGLKICITRSGGNVAASKNSYNRVYNDDGTWSYPRIEGNLLRKKGESYFENWEICGARTKKAERGSSTSRSG